MNALNTLLAAALMLSVTLSPCRATEAAPQQSPRQVLLERIAAIPAYAIHEESPEQFMKRLSEGAFRHDADRGISYLQIGGDGCFCPRLFIYSPEHGLHVIIDSPDGFEDEPAHHALYRYDAEGNVLRFSGVFLCPMGDV